MIRRALFLACLTHTACAGTQREASPAVAWVGSDSLDVEDLAHLLVLAQPYPLEEGAAVDLARHWQHALLLTARQEALPELAVAAEREWLNRSAISALRATRMPDARATARAQAAAVHARGDLRLIAHVLRRADAGARVEEIAIQERAAHAMLRELRAGAAWDEVNTRNEDDGAREQRGVIGLVARGELPQPLDSVAFSLVPGQVSEVVRSPAGYHVLYRPAFAAMNEEFTRRLAARLAADQETELGLAAAEVRNASLAPVAALRVRELALDPWAALDATDAIGTFEGGALQAGVLAAALAELSWDARATLADAPAEAREAFAGRLLIREALRVEARERVQPRADDHASVVDSLIAAARPSIPAPRGGTTDPRIAVDRYMGAIAARHVPMRIPPPALIRAAADASATGFRPDAITAAIARARRLLVAAGYTGGP